MRHGKLIGVAGLKGSGKTTFATMLESHHGWAHDSFAAPIRRFMVDVMNCSFEHLDRYKEIGSGVLGGQTPRRIMQLLGTEWMRNTCDEDVWVMALHKRTETLRQLGRNLVISDVRFENEARWIRDQGGDVVWIDRPGIERVDQHASERGLPAHLISFRINNDGGHDRLRVFADIFSKGG